MLAFYPTCSGNHRWRFDRFEHEPSSELDISFTRTWNQAERRSQSIEQHHLSLFALNILPTYKISRAHLVSIARSYSTNCMFRVSTKWFRRSFLPLLTEPRVLRVPSVERERASVWEPIALPLSFSRYPAQAVSSSIDYRVIAPKQSAFVCKQPSLSVRKR